MFNLLGMSGGGLGFVTRLNISQLTDNNIPVNP